MNADQMYKDAVAAAKSQWGSGWEHMSHEQRVAAVARKFVANIAAYGADGDTVADVVEVARRIGAF